MAPRGKSRKTGLTRADAARDAMKAFGFEMRMINETIKELLQVYGEEGWVLIEEASYKVLLDAILEKVEEKDRAEGQDQEQEEHGEDGGGRMDSNSTPPLNVEPATNPNQGTGTGTQTYLAEASSFTSEVVVNSKAQAEQEQHPERPPCHQSQGGSCLAMVAVDIGESSKAKETENIIANTEVNNTGVEEGLGGSIHSGRSSNAHNGWISSDEDEGNDSDDDEDAYVLLTPEPLSDELERLLMEAKRQRKRKSRWDVTPQEMNLVGASPPSSAINSDA